MPCSVTLTLEGEKTKPWSSSISVAVTVPVMLLYPPPLAVWLMVREPLSLSVSSRAASVTVR